jgi:hypothetical protein
MKSRITTETFEKTPHGHTPGKNSGPLLTGATAANGDIAAGVDEQCFFVRRSVEIHISTRRNVRGPFDGHWKEGFDGLGARIGLVDAFLQCRRGRNGLQRNELVNF